MFTVLTTLFAGPANTVNIYGKAQYSRENSLGDVTHVWTSYGIVVPLVEYVFGVQPDAYAKTIVFEPQLPDGWNDISIENLPVGDNLISFSRKKTSKGIEYSLTGTQHSWEMILKLKDLPGAKYTLNGKDVPFAPAGFQIRGAQNRLLVVQ